MKSPHPKKTIGKHWLIEMYACPCEKLKLVPFVQKTLSTAAKLSGASIVNESFHQFSPYGVSGVVVIEESHFTIHTWPEHHYAAIDCFTCGDLIDVRKAIDYLGEQFGTNTIEVNYCGRGDLAKVKASSLGK